MVCGHTYSAACRSLLTPTRPAAAISDLHPLISVCGLGRILPEHFCVYKNKSLCLFGDVGSVH